MKIVEASEHGVCWGVRPAHRVGADAMSDGGAPLPDVGALAHHPRLVAELARRGAPMMSCLDEVGGTRLAITAHGLAAHVRDAIAARGLDVVDATSPIVRRAQRAAAWHRAAGRFVIIFGDPAHVEVRGLIGWAGPWSVATTDSARAAEAVPPGATIGLVAQTTREASAYRAFAAELAGAFGAARVVQEDTVCGVTERQKAAAREVAARVDVVVVVGGRASANTRHLAEVCADEGAVVYQVETADDLRPEWFAGLRSVGLSAGASTPDAVLDEVRARLQAQAKGSAGEPTPAAATLTDEAATLADDAAALADEVAALANEVAALAGLAAARALGGVAR